MTTRILIQHRMSGLYFRALGSWTQFEPEAHQFASSSAALMFCLRHQLTGTQIVMKFGEQRYDIELPIKDENRWEEGHLAEPALK